MPPRVDTPLSLAAAAVALLALLVVPGSTAVSGPVLLVLTPTHGVHLLDLGVVALGLALATAVASRAWPQPSVALVPRPRTATA
jgi:hypothetical protein